MLSEAQKKRMEKPRTALLLCDKVNDEYLEQHGDYDQMYQQLFPELKLSCYRVFQGQFPNSVNDYDAYIINGSRKSVYEAIDWIAKLKQFVRDIHQLRKKCLGICFGHQLIAEALGGKVAKSNLGWCVGVQEFSVSRVQRWMRPAHAKLNMLMMCQDQVQKLPKGSRLLASTNRCPKGMFQLGEHILGIQAHPEFSKAYDKALMEARVKRIGKQRVQEGLASLDLKVDRDLIQKWMMEFLVPNP